MTKRRNIDVEDKGKNLLLALHSTSENLGVAVLDAYNFQQKITVRNFPLGKTLSNNLISCVEKIIPAENWKQLKRIAVATGPGGFTSTRLSIVMARTIAQQINCPLDGVSSFSLMAPRLSKKLENINKAFWITKNLPRRGVIAGKYQINNKEEINELETTAELIKPYLVKDQTILNPSVTAIDDVIKDVTRLLNLSFLFHSSEVESSWKNILPIYSTSPVD
tara:strand:- start:310 stop:972 length:663 start_codon:yes stop_codon:yes gene_type:complete